MSNISNVVRALQRKVSILENDCIQIFKYMLAGDNVSAAYILYPEDFRDTTYTDVTETIDTNNTDIIVLTQLYPELKSNEMVNKQIDIYQENNNKIKDLKEERINNEIAKWWLYFGK